MSREIKFRAWHKKYKEMYEVTRIDWEAEFVWVKYYDDDREEWFSREEHFADLELMQYTGLKDKNGVEIYEGDIVKWMDERDVYSIEFGEFGVPNFEEEGYQDLAVGYYLKPQHDLKEVEPFNMTIPLHKKYASRMEVIGNIYENPELLEVSK